jgi:hypothetical protein
MYYGSRKPSEKVKALRKRENEHRLFVAVAVSATVLIALCAVVMIIRLPWFSITEVRISGTEVTPVEKVKSAVIGELSGHRFFIIPNNSVLVYPRKKILEMIAREFPRLSDTTISPINLKTLSLATSERAGVYLWCGEEFEETTECYFTDDNGYLFARAPEFSGTIYLKVFGGTTVAKENALGATILSPEEFKEVVSFSEGLDRIGFTPHAVLLLGETYEFLISSSPNPSLGRIIVRANDEGAVLLKNLDAAIRVDPLKTKLEKYKQGLEYIDLRFSKKVYYKFFAEEASGNEE